jgi:phage terminase small subunit
MTAKQLEFCNEYIKSKNKIKAYQSIYSCSDAIARTRATELLQRDDIKEYIDAKNSTNVNREFIIANLKDIAINSPKESDRIRSLEILAKLTGMYEASKESELVIKIDY